MRKRLPFLLLALALALALAVPLPSGAQRDNESGDGTEPAGQTPADKKAEAQAAQPVVTAPDALLDSIQPLEKRGDLAGARRVLEKLLASADSAVAAGDAARAPTDAQKAHLAELRTITDAFARAEAYVAARMPRNAAASLPRLEAFTDPDIQFYLALRQGSLATRYGTEVLNKARAQADTAQARRMFERMVADTLLLPVEIRDQAQAALDSLARKPRTLRAVAAAAWNSSAMEQVTTAAGAFAKLFIFVALLVAAFFVIGNGRRLLPPRKGVTLRVEDLTADPADSASEARNALLLREIARDLRTLERAAGTSMGEKAEDLDGVANLRAEGEILEQFTEDVQDEPVQLGWIRLSPKQVLEILSFIRYRPCRTQLRGNLVAPEADSALLFVERYDVGDGWKERWKEIKNPQFYREEARGPDARRQVIRRFAVRYLYDSADQKPARTFESFRDYLDALVALERPAEKGYDPLAACRKLLESAVFNDPDNWQARMKLAEVLRKQGEYAAAVRHFRAVQELIADAHPPPSLQTQLETSPGYRLVVDYNVALTMSLGLDYADQAQAIEKFAHLLADLEAVK